MHPICSMRVEILKRLDIFFVVKKFIWRLYYRQNLYEMKVRLKIMFMHPSYISYI